MNSTVPERLAPLVHILTEARRFGRQAKPLADALIPANTLEAYQVNGAVAEALGWEPLGWKIAATTRSIQARLGVGEPIYGRTFRRFATASPATLKRDELLDPLVECECFATLGQDLPPREKPWTLDEIIDATATVHAGVEVAECRLPTRPMPPMTAILADGSAGGRYVFGPAVSDIRNGLEDIKVTLEIDGKVICQGSTSEVMGHPLRPLLWLAEERRTRFGEGLKAGEMISTGSMTGMVPVSKGQTARALFEGLEPIVIQFE